MAYTKQTWVSGDTVTAAKLNHMEDGIVHGGRIAVVRVRWLGYDGSFVSYVGMSDGLTPLDKYSIIAGSTEYFGGGYDAEQYLLVPLPEPDEGNQAIIFYHSGTASGVAYYTVNGDITTTTKKGCNRIGYNQWDSSEYLVFLVDGDGTIDLVFND